MSDVWGSFWQGAQIGEHYGDLRRNRDAYQEGGLDAVADAAGNVGDMAGMEQARTMQRSQRRFENEEQQQAFEWFEQNAPYARNVLRRARAIQDPQQRGAFLSSQRQRFQSLGFQPEQIDEAIANLTNPQTAEEAFASYDAAFSQHENPDWQIMDTTTGQIGAIDPATGGYLEGGQAPAGIGREWRPMTPQEAQAAGLPPNVPAEINLQTGQSRVIYRPPSGRSASGAGYPDAESTLRDLGGEWLD